jgi:hypothetical protein
VGASSWNSGMPDVFGAATWESLLHVINQGDINLDDDPF